MDDDRTVRVPPRSRRSDRTSDPDATDSVEPDSDLTVVVGRAPMPEPPPRAPARAAHPSPPRSAAAPRSSAALVIGAGVVLAMSVVLVYVLSRPSPAPREEAASREQAVPREPSRPEPVPAPSPPLAWQRTAPSDPEQRMVAGDSITFEAQLDGASDATVPVWTLDGREVGLGSELRLDTTPDDAGATRELVATAERGAERIERRWRLVIAAPNHPPVVESSSPPAGPLTLAAGEKRRLEVTATDTEESALTYTWERDGLEVGQGAGSSWTLEAAAPGETQVRVLVRDAAGAAADPVVWQVSIRPQANAPPRLMSQTPPGDRALRLGLGDAVDFRVQVRDPNPDDRLAYRWLVDGREVGRQARFRFVAPEPIDATHTIEAEVTDQARAKAAPARWTVEVTPKLRPVEATDWVERLRAAWERKDISTLRLYGVVAGDADANDTRRRLARYEAYRVQFTDVSARVDGPYATVSYTRTDSAGGKTVATARETYELEKHANGSVSLRGRGWR